MSKQIHEAITAMPLDKDDKVNAYALVDCCRNMVIQCQDKLGPSPRSAITTELSVEQEKRDVALGVVPDRPNYNLVVRMKTYTP